MNDAVGVRLTGRLPGLYLNAEGRAQAEGLPGRLAPYRVDAVYASPLERTVETATPTAKALGLPLNTDIRFAEFDFGDWSGASVADLEGRADWVRFVNFRGAHRAPNGERLAQVQARMIDGLHELADKHPGQTVAIFSHADAIRAALMHLLGVPTDYIVRIDIKPASISVVRWQDTFPIVLGVNLI